jgi:hypothetical protein
VKSIYLLLVKPVGRIFHLVTGYSGVVQNGINADIRIMLADELHIILNQATAV